MIDPVEDRLRVTFAEDAARTPDTPPDLATAARARHARARRQRWQVGTAAMATVGVVAVAVVSTGALERDNAPERKEGPVASNEPPLVGTEWSLFEFVDDGAPYTIDSDEDPRFRISASGEFSAVACNRFQGHATVAGDTITFGNAGSTLVACMDDGYRAFTSMVAKDSVTWRIASGVLELRTPDGDALKFRESASVYPGDGTTLVEGTYGDQGQWRLAVDHRDGRVAGMRIQSRDEPGANWGEAWTSVPAPDEGPMWWTFGHPLPDGFVSAGWIPKNVTRVTHQHRPGEPVTELRVFELDDPTWNLFATKVAAHDSQASEIVAYDAAGKVVQRWSWAPKKK